jgi:DNA invertase Pin-like site-specific DNA recombinase
LWAARSLRRPLGFSLYEGAAYARVSTDKQDLETQFDEIRSFIASRGWELVGMYPDVASGSKEDLAEFGRLLADVASAT